METKIIKAYDEAGLKYAASMLREGKTVIFPTETVYGLGADASNGSAIKDIFTAKGRPQDNPLIVHIPFPDDIEKYAHTESSIFFKRIAKEFMPGPITVILPKKEIISSEATAGLDSVGMRCPSHETAHRLLLYAKVPVAAPSANISGRPSPTEFAHVFEDMNGKVPFIIDGGKVDIGLESTVVSLLGEKVRILRPGGVTPEMLISVCGEENVITDEGVFGKLKEGQKPLSPGMKYRHYAPAAKITAVKGSDGSVRAFFKEKLDLGCAVLCWNEDKAFLPQNPKVLSMGSEEDFEAQASLLFEKLRAFDETNVKEIYARCPSREGLGLAVYNRLLRACAFEVIELDK
ncbi:MAG: threonylcarbamoyl-AMP synthase [Ruminococcaceae bacterium]|nr:threonylcarbamoyl-AMP synthase [Oscillospiraceae bacterium]